MAYVTGIAGSASALRDAIVAAATSKGWTWDSTLGALHKGSVAGQLAVSGLSLTVKAALGVGGGALVNPSPIAAGIRNTFPVTPHANLSYPLTYHIFINANPDEIVVGVNYQTAWWQWLGFGMARSLGGDTPVWGWGTCSSQMTPIDNNNAYSGVIISVDSDTSTTYQGTGGTCPAPFWDAYNLVSTSAIYSSLTSSWVLPTSANETSWVLTESQCSGKRPVQNLIVTQPNRWNGEAVLMQIPVIVGRPSSIISYLAEIAHMRFVRNDNLNDGQILTLGSEEWFTAPLYRKDITRRNGSQWLQDHSQSGTLGIAIRKTP